MKLVAGGREQHRLVGGGSSFGCLPTQQHFGLGTLERVESVDVWWPSGVTQRVEGIAANRRIAITEEVEGWKEG